MPSLCNLNANSVHYFIFKLCVPPILCTFNKYFIIFRAVELRHLFPSEMLKGVSCLCNL